MTRLVKRPDWVEQYFPMVTRISIDGCHTDHRQEKHLGYGAIAHAHCGGFQIPTICFSSQYPDGWDEDYPTMVFLHEYAHISSTAKYGERLSKGGRRAIHDKIWKDEFRALLVEWGYDGDVAKTIYTPTPKQAKRDYKNPPFPKPDSPTWARERKCHICGDDARTWNTLWWHLWNKHG